MAVEVLDPKTDKMKLVCGANLSDGRICMSPPMRGRDRCAFHGGKALRGPEHPWFVHGKYSKSLRRDILQNYYDSLKSGQQLSQSHEIALLDARIADLLKQAAGGRDVTEMLVGLFEIREKLEDLLGEKKQGDEIQLDRQDARKLIAELDSVMDEFKNERRKWDEVYQVIENRRKLIESERKAIIDSQHMMTEQQALTLLAALINIVKKHVIDPSVRNAISADIVSISSLPAGLRVKDRSGPFDTD